MLTASSHSPSRAERPILALLSAANGHAQRMQLPVICGILARQLVLDSSLAW
jgi:hypothetical protein